MSWFSRDDFEHKVKDYCRRWGWNIAEIDSSHATLIFTMASGRDQTLYVVPYQTTLEFSVPSMAMFEDLDDIPHYLSTTLLQRNASKKIGFWCIEIIGDNYVYSYMHNAELQLITPDYFGAVVRELVAECEAFEQELLNFLQRGYR